MVITFVLNEELSQGKTVTKQVENVSLYDSLIGCIRSIVGEHCRISFGNYYSNGNLMNFQELFPYIIREGIVEWDVPYENVSIKEFCNTNKIDPLKDNISVDIDNYGGGTGEDFLEIINWIVNCLPFITAILELPKDIKTITDITGKIYKYFAKNNRIPEIENVKDYLHQNRTWSKKELKKAFDIDDDNFLNMLMQVAGFRYEEEKYVKSDNPDNTNTSFAEDLVWGKSTCDSITSEVTEQIRDININLTSLKYYEDNTEITPYSAIKSEVQCFINKWSSFIVPGDGYCFIRVIDLPNEDEWDQFKEDAGILNSKIEEIVDSIQSSETHYIERHDAFIDDNEEDLDEIEEIDEIEESDNDEEDNEFDESDDYEDEDYIDEDEKCSSWCKLLSKALYQHDPVAILTDQINYLGLVEQIYDKDVLLHIISEDGKFMGYEYVELDNINMLKTNALSITIEKCDSSNTCNTYNISAKDAILEFAINNKKPVSIWINNSNIPVVNNANVIRVENMLGENVLVQIKDSEDKGSTWLDYEAISRIYLEEIN